jgi:hypothetical protein
MTTNQSIHELLSTKTAALVSWVSALLGLGTAIGVVNLLVGVLSACWLTAQLWNHFRYVVPKHKREKAEWEAKAAKKAVK